MTQTTKIVNYVARIQFPNKEPIWFGTLIVDYGTSPEGVRALMIKCIDRFIPGGYDIIDLIPGQVWITFD